MLSWRKFELCDCFLTFGKSSTGLGSLEKAYGPAKGGLVTVSYSMPGPMSGFKMLAPESAASNRYELLFELYTFLRCHNCPLANIVPLLSSVLRPSPYVGWILPFCYGIYLHGFFNAWNVGIAGILSRRKSLNEPIGGVVERFKGEFRPPLSFVASIQLTWCSLRARPITLHLFECSVQ